MTKQVVKSHMRGSKSVKAHMRQIGKKKMSTKKKLAIGAGALGAGAAGAAGYKYRKPIGAFASRMANSLRKTKRLA